MPAIGLSGRVGDGSAPALADTDPAIPAQIFTTTGRRFLPREHRRGHLGQHHHAPGRYQRAPRSPRHRARDRRPVSVLTQPTLSVAHRALPRRSHCSATPCGRWQHSCPRWRSCIGESSCARNGFWKPGLATSTAPIKPGSAGGFSASTLALKFRERNVHQQIGGDFFQFGFQRGEVAIFGQLQTRAGFEQGFAGHRRADDFAGKFLDVHARARQRMGDFTDNARAVMADDFEFCLPARCHRSRASSGRTTTVRPAP